MPNINPLSITDILKKVGKFKHEMENADDLTKMYSSSVFQDIF